MLRYRVVPLPNPRKIATGFTLIELLVVITIIAILASIALPVFNNVTERARVTQDLNNLRQIGIATQLYLNDHDDAIFTADQTTTSWMAALHPKYIPSWKIFQSPFDKRSPQESDTAAPISYGINKNALGLYREKITRPTAFILLAPAQNSAATVTFSGLPSTAVTVLRDVSDPGGTPPGGTHSSRKRINALYADLHSDSLPWATFKEQPTGNGDDDSNYRWDPAP